MSERLRKLPTQLNTPNIFVVDLVRVSLNASDVQRLGRCVPALRSKDIGVLIGQRMMHFGIAFSHIFENIREWPLLIRTQGLRSEVRSCIFAR